MALQNPTSSNESLMETKLSAARIAPLSLLLERSCGNRFVRLWSGDQNTFVPTDGGLRIEVAVEKLRSRTSRLHVFDRCRGFQIRLSSSNVQLNLLHSLSLYRPIYPAVPSRHVHHTRSRWAASAKSMMADGARGFLRSLPHQYSTQAKRAILEYRS